jgi:uncharacterized protein with HEPN domain
VPSKDPVTRFQDILDNIARIERFTEAMDFDAFSASEQTVYAVNHALLILSEAATKLGEDAEHLCPEIPWRDIRGLGNRLRHDYHNINLLRIWLVVEKELSTLKSAVTRAIQKLRDKESRFELAAMITGVTLPIGHGS